MADENEKDQPNGPGTLRDLVLRLQVHSDERHADNLANFADVKEQLKQIISGFPEGDPLSHRKFHEALIAKEKAWAKLFTDLQLKLIERGFWAMFGLLGLLILTGLGTFLKGLVNK